MDVGSLVLVEGRQALVMKTRDFRHFNESGLRIIPQILIKYFDNGKERWIKRSLPIVLSKAENEEKDQNS